MYSSLILSMSRNMSPWRQREGAHNRSGLWRTAGVSVDGYTLTLAANPWNNNLTQELLFACRYRLGTASNFAVYMSKADTSATPCTAPRCTSLRTGGEAALRRTSRRRACPTRRQQRWTSTASRFWTTLETGNTGEAEEDTGC